MKQHVVMVTGASAGVGRATAIAFARRGDAVGLLARGRGGLVGAQRDVEAAGGSALILEANVSEPDMVEAAGAALVAAFGPIDVWVNNAMASVFSPVKQMTAADFKRVAEVTYLGVVHGTLTALRRMLPRNEGGRAVGMDAVQVAQAHNRAGSRPHVQCAVPTEHLAMLNPLSARSARPAWHAARQ